MLSYYRVGIWGYLGLLGGIWEKERRAKENKIKGGRKRKKGKERKEGRQKGKKEG